MWPIQLYRVMSLESFHRCLYRDLASTGHTLSRRQEVLLKCWNKPYAAGEAHSRTAVMLLQVKLARSQRGGKVQETSFQSTTTGMDRPEKLLLTKHRL